jgi:hypothetical protein
MMLSAEELAALDNFRFKQLTRESGPFASSQKQITSAWE